MVCNIYGGSQTGISVRENRKFWNKIRREFKWNNQCKWDFPFLSDLKSSWVQKINELIIKIEGRNFEFRLVRSERLLQKKWGNLLFYVLASESTSLLKKKKIIYIYSQKYIYLQSKFFFRRNIFFCLLASKIIDTFFFSMWYLKISRYNFFKFGTEENFFFLTAHCKCSYEYKM